MAMIRYRVLRLSDGSFMECDRVQEAIQMSAVVLEDGLEAGQEANEGTILNSMIRDKARSTHAESEYWTDETLSEQEVFDLDMQTQDKLTDNECLDLWVQWHAENPQVREKLAVYRTDLESGAYQYERMGFLSDSDGANAGA